MADGSEFAPSQEDPWRSRALALPGMAAHFAELRQRLASFLAEQGAVERGWCTPAEDEELLAIWVEWWRVRCALLDLVTEARHERDDAAGSERPFLVGFAAAVVLVDAARELHRRCHHLHVLRRRLNQPHPEVGIPWRSFERIERGLTKARHLAALALARRRYRESAPRLDALAAEAAYAPLLALLERHLPALAVSRRRALAVHLRVKARRVGAAIGRRGFGVALYRLQAWAGSAAAELRTRRGHRSELPEAVIAALRTRLRAGDVLITRKEHVLTNRLLPGFWPHAVLVLGRQGEAIAFEEPAAASDPGGCWVLEAQKDGVRVRPLVQALACDALCLMRPRLDARQCAEGLARGLCHRDKPYDFAFDCSRSQCLVCSEVVYRAYDGLGEIRLQPVVRFGRPTVSPQDLLACALSGSGFDLLACATPEGEGELLLGAAAAERAQACIRTGAYPHS